MTLENVEKYRARHPLGFKHSTGDNFGWFEVPSIVNRHLKLSVMVGPMDENWQHVSVSTRLARCPYWEEMCQIKDLFFGEDKCVVQFHPKKKDYINIASNCLHLWALNDGTEFPMPPRECV